MNAAGPTHARRSARDAPARDSTARRLVRAALGLVRPPAALVAAARVAEAAVRRSARVRRFGRAAAAALARWSPDARAFVRIRLMRII